MGMSRFVWMLILGVAMLLGYYGFASGTVPPMYKGVLLIFGKRTNEVLDEGWHWIVPGIMSLIIVNAQTITETNTGTRSKHIDNIFTPQDHAQFEADIVVTFQPDPDNLIKLLNQTNPQEILWGKIESAARSFPNTPNGPKTAIEMIDSKEAMGEAILASLGTKKKGGYAIEDIGLMITVMNVKALMPNAELRKALAEIAKENAQRLAETIQAQTNALAVKKFLIGMGVSEENVDALTTKALSGDDQALRIFTLVVNMTMVDRGKATQDIKTINLGLGGNDKSLSTIAQMIAAMVEKKGGGS